jgi:hypothetical protein
MNGLIPVQGPYFAIPFRPVKALGNSAGAEQMNNWGQAGRSPLRDKSSLENLEDRRAASFL